MPTYAYACRDCGHDLEVVQSFTDDALTECPECGGSLRKKFHAVGIAFKGSGFYKNDSRGSSKRSGDGGSSSSSDSSSSTSSSSESKSTESKSSEKKSPDKKGSEKKGSDSSSSKSKTASASA